MSLLSKVSHKSPDQFRYAVALGYVPGWTSFRRFGMNNDVPATGSEHIWPPGTAKVLPTSAGALSVVSSNAADDSVAVGAGGWTVQVEGLDSDYVEISESIILDGQTPVASTSSDWFRVNRAYITTAGTGETNTGSISISIGGALQGYIEPLEGESHQTHYTVPAGKSVVISYFSLGIGRMAGATDAHITSQIKLFGDNSSWRAISDIYLFNGETYDSDHSVTVLPEKTEIRQIITSTATTQVFGVYGGFLVLNEVL